MFEKKVKCCSCLKKVPASAIRVTRRAGEEFPLCGECWDAAVQVQAALRPVKLVDAARERNRWRNSA